MENYSAVECGNGGKGLTGMEEDSNAAAGDKDGGSSAQCCKDLESTNEGNGTLNEGLTGSMDSSEVVDAEVDTILTESKVYVHKDLKSYRYKNGESSAEADMCLRQSIDSNSSIPKGLRSSSDKAGGSFAEDDKGTSLTNSSIATDEGLKIFSDTDGGSSAQCCKDLESTSDRNGTLSVGLNCSIDIGGGTEGGKGLTGSIDSSVVVDAEDDTVITDSNVSVDKDLQSYRYKNGDSSAEADKCLRQSIDSNSPVPEGLRSSSDKAGGSFAEGDKGTSLTNSSVAIDEGLKSRNVIGGDSNAAGDKGLENDCNGAVDKGIKSSSDNNGGSNVAHEKNIRSSNDKNTAIQGTADDMDANNNAVGDIGFSSGADVGLTDGIGHFIIDFETDMTGPDGSMTRDLFLIDGDKDIAIFDSGGIGSVSGIDIISDDKISELGNVDNLDLDLEECSLPAIAKGTSLKRSLDNFERDTDTDFQSKRNKDLSEDDEASDDLDDSDYVPSSEIEDEMDDGSFSKRISTIIKELPQISYQALDDVGTNSRDNPKSRSIPLTSNCKVQDSLGRPSTRALDERQKVRDSKEEGIYIKVYRKSFDGKKEKQKKSSRPYDTVHACFVCGKLQSHIQNHLEKVHAEVKEVKEIIALKNTLKTTGDKKVQCNIQRAQSLLRFKGDHEHNIKVQYHKAGELLISRRETDGSFNNTDYGPCPKCLEWMKLDTGLSLHQKSCCGNKEENVYKETKGNLKVQSEIVLGKWSGLTCEKIKNEVFPIMRVDDISSVAKSDPLILALGEAWLSKSVDNKLRRKYYASFRMRLAARLLILIREKLENEDITMYDVLEPSKFDTVAKAALEACTREADDEDDLRHPSVAIKLGFDISRLASLKLAMCIKNKSTTGREDTMNFIHLMKIEWSAKVTKLARVVTAQHHFDTTGGKPLPHPKDIQTIAEYLLEEIKKINLDDRSRETFRRCAILVLTRLMTYNRRRSGEMEALSMKSYFKRHIGIDDVECSLLGDLTKFEKHLLETQELIFIRGKRGKKVPVLVPEDCQKPLAYLCNHENRKQAKIMPTNQYVFANSYHGVIRGYDALKLVSEECSTELLYASRITSTGLRKYCATITQVLALKDHQLKWVCRHLGHEENIHDTFYRQTSGAVERIQLGKLMLMQDHNIVDKFSGQSLDQVQFDDIVKVIDAGDENKTSQENNDNDSADHCDEGGCLDIDEGEIDLFKGDGQPPEKKRKLVKRTPWTQTELDEIKQYFNKFLDTKTTPSQAECRLVIDKCKKTNGSLCRRTPALIIKKISYLNHK